MDCVSCVVCVECVPRGVRSVWVPAGAGLPPPGRPRGGGDTCGWGDPVASLLRPCTLASSHPHWVPGSSGVLQLLSVLQHRPPSSSLLTRELRAGSAQGGRASSLRDHPCSHPSPPTPLPRPWPGVAAGALFLCEG